MFLRLRNTPGRAFTSAAWTSNDTPSTVHGIHSTVLRNFRSELAQGGDVFLDLSSPRSVTDDDFRDGLHLGEDGARRFSTELGEVVAPFVQAAAR